MNATDQLKVINAGFKIIREREAQPIMLGDQKVLIYIACKTKLNPEWHLLKNEGGTTMIFASKAARRREMKKLLSNSKTVED